MTVASVSVASLATPVNRVVEELDQIESVFGRCRGNTAVRSFRIPYVPTEDGCLVSLWDAWNRFIRALLITSASGPVQGLSGTVHVPQQSRTEAQVLHHLKATKKSTGIRLTAGEPKWYDTSVLPSLANVLGLANEYVIVNAATAHTVQLGPVAVANPLEEIRVCRNYIAHKGPSTLAQVIALPTVQRFDGLSEHCRKLRFGVETFSEWKEACLAIAEAAAQ